MCFGLCVFWVCELFGILFMDFCLGLRFGVGWVWVVCLCFVFCDLGGLGFGFGWVGCDWFCFGCVGVVGFWVCFWFWVCFGFGV